MHLFQSKIYKSSLSYVGKSSPVDSSKHLRSAFELTVRFNSVSDYETAHEVSC